ncbi:MAG: transcription initiation factor IIB family protein [Candidatus Lokiarchaeota archaeon]|nr:transcription initiation factor IIB family protein [Candidatus Lokiarchaeota archaeon]MCK4479031.1 transcription initiation factor IIB family protein [Candidatus Lokiarchaeota archaeon]
MLKISQIETNREDTGKCPECGGKTILNSFEKICKECGLVINNLYRESSFIFHDLKNKNSLSKQYVALGERTDFIGGLGSFIDYEKSNYLKDKSGKLLPPSEQKLFRRLKKNYAQFLRIKNHETEYRIFNILNKISLYLNLNKNIRNNVAYYYKKIVKSEEKVINNISLIAFCIFFASRKENHNAPITINEISNAFQNFGHRVNPRLILRDGIRYKHYLNNDSLPHRSEDYLIRLVDEVIKHKFLKERILKKGVLWSEHEFQNKLIMKCREILEALSLWHRGGRNPFILTGAIIYLADKLIAKDYDQKTILTQKIISEATSIAEYSIRDHYVNLLKPIFIN